MSDIQFGFLGLTRTQCRDEFTATYFTGGLGNVIDSGNNKDCTVARKVSLAINALTSRCVFGIFCYLDSVQADLRLESSIAEALEMNLQEDANMDVNEVLNQEDPINEERMQEIVQERVADALGPMQKELQKLRQQLKSKGSGGKTGHLSQPTSNGQKTNASSTGSGGSSKGKKSNTKRVHWADGKGRGRGRGNQRGSGRGSRGRGSNRS